MGLLQRLLGTEEPKLAVHQFMAGLAEFKRGAVTKQNIIDAFGLSVDESNQLQTFLDNIDTDVISRDLIHDVLLLGETGKYTENQVKSRLGL